MMYASLLRKTCLLLGLATTCGALGAAPDGATIAREGGREGAPACAGCHGAQGQGNRQAGYPYLAGLPAAYLENQLHAFANGSRDNQVMKPFARLLTADEIGAVADYYASLPVPGISGDTSTGGDKPGAGEAIARQGKWKAGVPACFRCHGDGGTGVGDHFPPLRGQPIAYLTQQLFQWRSGERGNDPVGLMQAVARGLDEDEISAVSAYLASLPPPPGPEPGKEGP